MNQLMTAFEQGGTIVLINFVFARDIVQMLLKEKITGLAGVPTVWSLLAQPNSTLAKQPLPHLRYITNTGGAMPQAVLDVLRKTLTTTQHRFDVRPHRSFSLHLSSAGRTRSPPHFDGQSHSRLRNHRAQRARATLQTRRNLASSCIVGRPFRWATGTGPKIPSACCVPIRCFHRELGDCENVCYSGRSGKNGRRRLSLFRRPPRHDDQVFRLSHQPHGSRRSSASSDNCCRPR